MRTRWMVGASAVAIAGAAAIFFYFYFSWRTPAISAVAPPFRAVLSDAEYQSRLATISVQPDPIASAVIPRPGLMVEVVDVEPGSQAAGVGIVPGDLLLTLNGTPIRTLAEITARESGSTSLGVMGANGKLRSVSISGGKVGITTVPWYRPEVEFMGRTPSNAQTRDAVLAGILLRRDDPDVAESAWHRAIAAGYTPDDLSNYCGLEIALRQARFDDAFAYAQCINAKSDAGGSFIPQPQYRVAIAAGRLNDAIAIAEANNDLKIDVSALKNLAAIETRQGRKLTAATQPSDALKGWRQVDVLPTAVALATQTEAEFLGRVRSGQPFDIDVPVSQTTSVYFGPQAHFKNADFRVRFRAKQSGPEGQFANVFKVALFDRVAHGPRAWGEIPNEFVLTAGTEASGAATIIRAGHATEALEFHYLDRAARLDGKTAHEIRLIRVDGDGLIFFDNQRIASVPVDQSIADIGFFMQCVGMAVDVESVQASELVPSAGTPGQ